MEDKIITTRDLPLATYLKYSGYSIVVRKSENGNKCEFIVENVEDKNNLIANFFNNKLTVEPVSYMQSMKVVKDLMFSLINNS